MTFYIRRGTALHITDAANLQIENTLAPATYTIKVTPNGELYLDQIGDFELPAKLYGDTTKNAERILRTFRERTVSTGVLLTGLKGSGKSLLAKTLATRCREDGIPTLVIGAPYCGEKFNEFIQSIDQPAVVLFDEFEKVYNSQQQQDMLTLLDGMYPTKKLFVLTCNDRYRIDSHMRNRPGRLFYALDFAGMSEAEVRGYCADQLANQANTEGVVKFSKLFGDFNFDMLKALVEEMNRYDEPAAEAYKMLNAQPGSDTANEAMFSITLYSPSGLPLKVRAPDHWRGVPLSGAGRGTEIEIPVNFTPTEETIRLAKAVLPKKTKKPSIAGLEKDWDADEDNTASAAHFRQAFRAEHFAAELSLNGSHAFRNEQGYVVVFAPMRAMVRDYTYAF